MVINLRQGTEPACQLIEGNRRRSYWSSILLARRQVRRRGNPAAIRPGTLDTNVSLRGYKGIPASTRVVIIGVVDCTSAAFSHRPFDELGSCDRIHQRTRSGSSEPRILLLTTTNGSTQPQARLSWLLAYDEPRPQPHSHVLPSQSRPQTHGRQRRCARIRTTRLDARARPAPVRRPHALSVPRPARPVPRPERHAHVPLPDAPNYAPTPLPAKPRRARPATTRYAAREPRHAAHAARDAAADVREQPRARAHPARHAARAVPGARSGSARADALAVRAQRTSATAAAHGAADAATWADGTERLRPWPDSGQLCSTAMVILNGEHSGRTVVHSSLRLASSILLVMICCP